MDPIKHHLSASILTGYAAGVLPEAFSLVVATHISLCDECRAQLAGFDAIGGAVLDRCPAVSLADDALDRTLARLSESPQTVPPRPRLDRGSVFPAPLRDYVGGDLDAVRWRPLGGGVRHARLKTLDSAMVRLLHIPAGMEVPDHGHRGLELTLVLQGAFRDGSDRFARGDVETADETTQHTPVAEAGVDCICLAATDAPLKFNRMVHRLVQPFLGI